MRNVTLAITGASGAPYATRLLQVLLDQEVHVHLLISKAAQMVFAYEENQPWPSGHDRIAQHVRDTLSSKGTLSVYGKEDWTSPVASGSGAPDTMIVCPCSTGTLASIATGQCDNLIERGADVVLKETGTLILVVRETPLSEIHLQNMLTVKRAGAVVMPAAPGFYHQPESINDLVDFMVARILKAAGFEQTLLNPWGASKA
ncbi:flavin prenyltransferase UbiX [Reinekea blandensis]|uniref:Flavin prenyltransferase UbiX n=1 Tax=Reinekea blandensis MED297 TaxID=314283 RepID=A4BAI3_9GAMM|nr:flavin prenyltransferase UbiX [Reinekea blandensis]EAR10939.1 3-octaprenyl-4-hydroxybenzoate carboxy-lyase [Reinekea sp. MED297] [Reinekea blandensis MED297]